jgi:TPR repeat protein
MSYIVEVVVPALPGEDALAWQAADALRASQDEGGARHPLLVRLHDVVTAVYPCLTRCREEDLPFGECPWSDGPLIDNVGATMAVFGLRGVENMEHVVRYVVSVAAGLGLTTLDAQLGKIHRPDPGSPGLNYYVSIVGIWRGLRKDQVAAALARAFRKDEAQMRAMLELPRAIVRMGLDLLGALQYQETLFTRGCNVRIGAATAGLPISPEGGNRPADLQRLRASAEQGDVDAQTMLGFFCLRGIDVSQDSAQAAQWFERAARQGDVRAQKLLAYRYQDGDGVAMSYAWALEWMRKAAEQGDVDAQMDVGLRYLWGKGVSPDKPEAIRWFRRAAEQGHPEAQYELGQLLRSAGMPQHEHVEAAFWLGRAAARGDVAAQLAYGEMFWRGEGGLPHDRAQAFSWFRRAAEQGSGAAMAHVSLCYEMGEGVEQDAAQALIWCRKAAEADNAWGQTRLGRYYDDADLLPEDKRQAFMWYARAAGQDYADAQTRLALLYLEGWGGADVDGRKEAMSLLAKAAAGGDAAARDLLVRLRA